MFGSKHGFTLVAGILLSAGTLSAQRWGRVGQGIDSMIQKFQADDRDSLHAINIVSWNDSFITDHSMPGNTCVVTDFAIHYETL